MNRNDYMNKDDITTKHKKFQHWHKISGILALYDIVVMNLSYFFVLWLRFDCHYTWIPEEMMDTFIHFAPFYTIAAILIFRGLRLYRSIWRFASYDEFIRVLLANFICMGVQLACTLIFFVRMPISYYLFGTMVQFIMTLGIRFSYRLVLLERGRRAKHSKDNMGSQIMIVGAGSSGQMILQDILKNENETSMVACFIDDNPNKWNRFIEGIPVVGGRDSIPNNVEKYEIDKIFVAIPSAEKEEMRAILNICNKTGCELKTLPGIYQFVTGEISVASMRKVEVEDLLGRDAIKADLKEIFLYLKDKVILVTGGGGSIGSELCRQIASHQPKQLIIFDVYENNAYDIEQELRKKYPELNLIVLIGSVRDSRKLNSVFETYKPNVVYHAAAHKHVPLMETSPCEAVKNNVIGTYKTAYAAMRNNCDRFILISTDKAVNPTNVMGATKRLCEMVVQSFDAKIKEGKENELPVLYTHEIEDYEESSELPEGFHSKTEFVAVRFGNVLGSNGSVIPLFKKQIEAGGPVTVTHPEIVRYFMTIPEAVELVLQAGTYAEGGEIFVLDMGEPVKIDDLARNLIRLSGFKPDVDIKIEYTGLRPGEKLYEEKLMAEEGLEKTENDLIHIGKPIDIDTEKFFKDLVRLMEMSYENIANIRIMIEEMVPTYHPKN